MFILNTIPKGPTCSPLTQGASHSQKPSKTRNGTSANKSVLSDKFKSRTNVFCNGTAVIINAATFLVANIKPDSSLMPVFDVLTQTASRVAKIVQGAINAVIAYEDKNLIPCIGSSLEIPISFMPWDDIYFHRGLSVGLNLYQSALSGVQRVEDGKPVVDENQKPIFYGDFRKEGWLEGLKITAKEGIKLFKDSIVDPLNKDRFFAQHDFSTATMMWMGWLTHALGLKTIGKAIRYGFALLNIGVLAMHKEDGTLPNFLKKKSEVKSNDAKAQQFLMPTNYAKAGIIWTITVLADWMKELPFIENNIERMTDLVLGTSRLGNICLTHGNQYTHYEESGNPSNSKPISQQSDN